MGEVLARSGNPEASREIRGRLEARAQAEYVPQTSFAIVNIGLGEHDAALSCLERACDHHDLPLVSLNAHPVYDDLRGAPRFEAVLRRMHFRR
jgi:hypothetical protein